MNDQDTDNECPHCGRLLVTPPHIVNGINAAQEAMKNGLTEREVFDAWLAGTTCWNWGYGGWPAWQARAALASAPIEREAAQQGAAVTMTHDQLVAAAESIGMRFPEAQQPPSVEQAIVALAHALAEARGWTQGYADSVIRDAIDRKATE